MSILALLFVLITAADVAPHDSSTIPRAKLKAPVTVTSDSSKFEGRLAGAFKRLQATEGHGAKSCYRLIPLLSGKLLARVRVSP